MKRVRIVNTDGVGYHTKITDEGTGKEIEMVSRVQIDFTVMDEITAKLTIHSPIVDIIAHAEEQSICPCCGALRQKEDQGELARNLTPEEVDLIAMLDKRPRTTERPREV